MSIRTLSNRFIQRFQRARFLSVSLLIHLILGILLGSIVIFKSVRDDNIFVSSVGSFLSADESTEATEDPAMEFEEPGADSPETSDSSAMMQASAIASLSETPASFELSGFSEFQTTGASFSSSKLTGLPGNGSGSGGSGGRGGGVGLGKMNTLFGSKEPMPGGFTGKLYDLKQSNSGERLPTPAVVTTVVHEFVESNWNESVFRGFFQAPITLSASQIFIPRIGANEAPKAFQVEGKVEPTRWLVHYKGTIRPPRDMTLRFVGHGDNVLIVRVQGKEVLDGSIRAPLAGVNRTDYGRASGGWRLFAGEWVQLRRSESYSMEILIGEDPGGDAGFLLLYEEKGVKYEPRSDDPGFLRLPVFQALPTKLPSYSVGETAPDVMPPDDKLIFGERGAR